MFEVKGTFVDVRGNTTVTPPKSVPTNSLLYMGEARRRIANAIQNVRQAGNHIDSIMLPVITITTSGLELDILLDAITAKPIEAPRKGMTLYSFGSSSTPMPEQKTWIMNFNRVFEPAVLNMNLPRNTWYRLYDEDHKRWESSYFLTPGDTRQYWGTPQTP